MNVHRKWRREGGCWICQSCGSECWRGHNGSPGALDNIERNIYNLGVIGYCPPIYVRMKRSVAGVLYQQEPPRPDLVLEIDESLTIQFVKGVVLCNAPAMVVWVFIGMTYMYRRCGGWSDGSCNSGKQFSERGKCTWMCFGGIGGFVDRVQVIRSDYDCSQIWELDDDIFNVIY